MGQNVELKEIEQMVEEKELINLSDMKLNLEISLSAITSSMHTKTMRLRVQIESHWVILNL